jgi:hypothetical protein
MGSLSNTLFSYIGQSAALSPNSDQFQRTPLEQLLSWTHYLPLTVRKWLVTLCRVQADPNVNIYLSSEYDKLEADPFIGRNSNGYPIIIDKTHILHLATQLYDSSLSCTILSYWCRAESTDRIDDFKEEKWKAFDKEISAALYFVPHEQKLDYSQLFSGETRPLFPGVAPAVQERTVLLFKQGIRKIKQTWSRYEESEVLLPFYNGKKTVGYATQEEFHRRNPNW